MRPNKHLAAVCIAALLGGCTMAPKYERPSPAMPSDWNSGTGAQSQNTTLADWRQVITDEPTKRLVELALTGNRDLRVAALNIEQAQAQYQIERADLFPKINANGAANMQRTPAKLSSTGHAVTTRTYSVGLGFSAFELDLFGRVRSLKDKALEQYLATEESRRSAELSLVAEVATAYMTLAADREHLALAEETLTTQRETYELTKLRFENGIANELDLRREQTTVDQARLDVAQYRTQVTQDENLLALLVGQPLAPDLLPAKRMADIAPLAPVPAGLPSDVLFRRPDVLAAEHSLKAANANIGAARAMHFPIISLTGSYGTASPQVNGLFQNGSQLWTFAPQITLPIFAAGAISAGVKAAEAGKGITVAQYEKAVQTAFREVSDCLSKQAALDEQFSARSSLAEATAKSFELATLRYQAGADGYLSTLDAQRSNVTAQQGLIASKLARQANLLTLYKALGGGWPSQYAETNPSAPATAAAK